MIKNYHAIPTQRLDLPCHIMQPPKLPEVVHINDTALSAMFDLKYHKPPITQPNKTLTDAKAEMKTYSIPFLLVVDKEEKITGIITSEDILGEKPVKLIEEKRITRNEIEVEMIMTPIQEIPVIDIEDLHHSKVGHVIQTFRELKMPVLLVVKIDDADQRIVRGIFSASLISKQLDKDITTILSEPQSIAELQHDLYQ